MAERKKRKNRETSKTTQSKTKETYVKAIISKDKIVIAFIVVVIIVNIQRALPTLIEGSFKTAARFIRNPQYSYEDKMGEKVGREYLEWTKLVKKHTDVNSRVFHPPQMWPWPQSGNPEFSQYFLHPAKLITENLDRLVNKKDVSHVLIARGEGKVEENLYGWPKFPVFARKIYYLPQRRITEINGLDGLKAWQSNSERTVNTQSKNLFDITYTSSLYDYWIKDVDMPLSLDANLSIEVKSNWPNSTSFFARVFYGGNNEAVFSSSPNALENTWETLTLENLYNRAQKLGELNKWDTRGMTISGLGINPGHPAKMPYLEGWGIIEVENGDKKDSDLLNKELVNNQTQLLLANINNLNGDYNKAIDSYKKAILLEPAEPWGYFWLAEIADKKNDPESAEENYKKTISLAPEISWFHYETGKFYQEKGNYEKALSSYQDSIDIHPENFWAHLSSGEVYEAMNRMDLAYKEYTLASAGPRRDHSSGGKTAWNRLKRIESEQSSIIKKNLAEISKNQADKEARFALGSAYMVIGNLSEARKQYKLAYELGVRDKTTWQAFPPSLEDQLSHPLYGRLSRGADKSSGSEKFAVLLDNYHSFIKYPEGILPSLNGTVELSWKPPSDLESDKSYRNLIFQFKSLVLRVRHDKINFEIFNKKEQKWVEVKGLVRWENNKWYDLAISYGREGTYLFVNKKQIGWVPLDAGIDNKRDLFLGRGPLLSSSKNRFYSGYFKSIKISEYQKTVID